MKCPLSFLPPAPTPPRCRPASPQVSSRPPTPPPCRPSSPQVSSRPPTLHSLVPLLSRLLPRFPPSVHLLFLNTSWARYAAVKEWIYTQSNIIYYFLWALLRLERCIYLLQAQNSTDVYKFILSCSFYSAIDLRDICSNFLEPREFILWIWTYCEENWTIYRTGLEDRRRTEL